MSRERGSAVGGVIQVNQLRLHSHVFTSEQKQTDIDTAAVFHFGVLYIGNFLTTVCNFFFSTCHSASGTMAGPIPREEALKRGGADLRFTLSRNDVEDDLQAAFFTNGITTIQKFSSFFRSEDDLIQVMRDSFGTDAADGLEARAQLASVICAWRETQTKNDWKIIG